MDDLDLVRTTLKGFTKQWISFIKGIVAREKLHDWTRLWDDFIQEELRDEDFNGGRHKIDDENLALVILAKKGNFKKTANGEYNSQNSKKKDMGKLQSQVLCTSQLWDCYRTICSKDKRLEV
jgi:hypothetical protein